VKLEADELTTDGHGAAVFTLPAAEQPSRYVLTAPGERCRPPTGVRTTREILIERGPDDVHADRARAASARRARR